MYSKNDVWILIDKNNHIVVIENKLFSTNYQDLLGQNEVSSNYKNCAYKWDGVKSCFTN